MSHRQSMLATSQSMVHGFVRLEVQQIATLEVLRGVEAACNLLALEGIAPCAAYSATAVLDHLIDTGSDYTEKLGCPTWKEWCRRADLWLDAEELALNAALSSSPDGIYRFRFFFDWEGRSPDCADGLWQNHHKGVPQTFEWRYTHYC